MLLLSLAAFTAAETTMDRHFKKTQIHEEDIEWPQHERHRTKIRLSVNEPLVSEFLLDFERFGVNYLRSTKDERADVGKALGQAWANTAAKLIMNFGRLVTPVAEDWSNLMAKVQVNPNCNQKCAEACLNPAKRESMYFDQRCLAACGCQFEIGKMTIDEV